MRRKITEKLLDWKQNRKGESALLIEGARRVGKSFIVEAESLRLHFMTMHYWLDKVPVKAKNASYLDRFCDFFKTCQGKRPFCG